MRDCCTDFRMVKYGTHHMYAANNPSYTAKYMFEGTTSEQQTNKRK